MTEVSKALDFMDQIAQEDDNIFARDIQAFRNGVEALNKQADAGNGPEVVAGTTMTVDALAAVLMATMGHNGDCDRFTTADKVFWIGMADAIGPDWLAKLRKCVAFAIKADEF